jgi:membrane-bound ClpP family serine protease
MSKIIGILVMLAGLLWLIKPEALRNRLKRKLNRRLKFVVYVFVIMFGFLLIGSVLGAEGLFPKIVGIAGLVLVIKGILLLTSKASEKMLDWVADRPVLFFRLWALVVFAIGAMLFLS